MTAGADPNAKPDKVLGDVQTPRARPTALHIAIAIPDVALAKKCCLLLLLHKADPTAAYQPFVRGRTRLGLSYETEGTEGVSVLEQVSFARSSGSLLHAVAGLFCTQ